MAKVDADKLRLAFFCFKASGFLAISNWAIQRRRKKWPKGGPGGQKV
jgi:hypothetical protein